MRALKYSLGTTLASAGLIVGLAGPAAAHHGGGADIHRHHGPNSTNTITTTRTFTLTNTKTNSGIIQRNGDNQTAIQGDSSAVARVKIDQSQTTNQSSDQSNTAGEQNNSASIEYNSTGGGGLSTLILDNDQHSNQTNTLNNTNNQSMSQSNSNSQSQTVSQSATGVSM